MIATGFTLLSVGYPGLPMPANLRRSCQLICVNELSEPWHPSKMSYGGMGRGEQVLPGTTAITSYPSRDDLYRNYFAHPPFSPITSSPYNCAFYQQQNMMLAPVQVGWLLIRQRVMIDAHAIWKPMDYSFWRRTVPHVRQRDADVGWKCSLTSSTSILAI